MPALQRRCPPATWATGAPIGAEARTLPAHDERATSDADTLRRDLQVVVRRPWKNCRPCERGHGWQPSVAREGRNATARPRERQQGPRSRPPSCEDAIKAELSHDGVDPRSRRAKIRGGAPGEDRVLRKSVRGESYPHGHSAQYCHGRRGVPWPSRGSTVTPSSTLSRSSCSLVGLVTELPLTPHAFTLPNHSV